MATRITVYPPRVDAALAVLRMVVGVIFLAHGSQKLFTFGLDGVASGFGEMGVPYAEIVGPSIAFLEFFGGIFLIFGLFTRLAAFLLACDVAVAMALVHFKSGFFLPNGYEFVLLLMVSGLSLTLAGAGAWSLDAWLAGRRWRPLGEYTQVPVRTGTPYVA